MIANKQLKEAVGGGPTDERRRINGDTSNIFKREDSDLTPTTLEKNSVSNFQFKFPPKLINCKDR